MSRSTIGRSSAPEHQVSFVLEAPAFFVGQTENETSLAGSRCENDCDGDQRRKQSQYQQ